MVKYRLDTSKKYVLPDAVKKFYNQEKLSQAKTERDKVRIEIDELNKKIEEAKNKKDEEEVRRLRKSKEELNEKLSSLNKSIYNINAELYDSTVNFNNANISELKANISDISSVVNNSEYLNEKISEKIANMLKSNVSLNDIFKTDNFKQMLANIIKEVNEYDKERDEYKNIEEALKDVKDTNSENDNMEIWKAIRDDVKILVPNFKVMLSNVTTDINEINDMKDKLTKLIFNKGEINIDDINDYALKLILLSGLYKLVDTYLNGKYPNFIVPGEIHTKFKVYKADDFYNLVNNLREWFSKNKYDKYDDKNFKKNEQIITNISKEKLLDGDFVKEIELNDIKEAIDIINNNIIPNQKKFVDEQIKVSEGLDLDEIQFWRSLSSTNINIMNNIIQSLNDINETLKGIKDLMSKQSSSNDLAEQTSSKQNSQKLGRFKVEKYKPNMSITEFKKLFDSKP